MEDGSQGQLLLPHSLLEVLHHALLHHDTAAKGLAPPTATVGLLIPASPSLSQLQREAEIEADACAAALLRDESAAKKSSKSRQRRPAKK